MVSNATIRLIIGAVKPTVFSTGPFRNLMVPTADLMVYNGTITLLFGLWETPAGASNCSYGSLMAPTSVLMVHNGTI